VITAGLVSMLGTGSNTFITVTTACTGPHQYVRTGSLVTLDGRCSDFTEAAPDNAHMLYEWSVKSRPQGSNAIVGNASNSVLASFVADIDGEYEIELATMIGGFSEVAKVTTRVTATTGNARPMVEAGPYQEVAIGDTVQLQATASDADDNPLSYSWSFQPGSEAAVLSDATSPDPTFVANDSGDYLVDVVVNDGAVDSLSDTVLIRSRDANFTLPVAVAGADQFALTGSQVNLNGINSYSPYDRPLTYRWRMISRPFGSVTGLSDKTTAQPSFIADKPGAYLIKLVVSDGAVDNSRSLDDVYEDRLIVIVGDNQPPVANGGEDHAVSTGTSATLDGVASSDPELATLTYS